MPITVEVVERGVLKARIEELRSRGYSCRADDDGDWECMKLINEIFMDIRLIIVKSAR